MPAIDRTLIGRDGFSEFFRLWTDVFENWIIGPEKFIDAGGDRVVLIVNQSATGRGSGAPLELRSGIVYTLENSLITDIAVYMTAEQALEAAGLSE